MKTTIERIVFGTLAVITFTAIFLFSNENGEQSSSTSEKLVRNIINIIPITSKLDDLKKEDIIQNSQFIVRKMAHFTIYFIAGLNVAGFLNTYNKVTLKNKIIISLLMCICYATSDEIHQIFSNGRSASIRDILIDSLGSLFGIIILLKLRCFFTNRKFIKIIQKN